MRRSAKGSVLAWVLVSAVILMIVCSSMAKMILMRAQVEQRNVDSAKGTKINNQAVNSLMSFWVNANGTSNICASGVGYTCTSVGCSCAVGHDCTTGGANTCATCCNCVPNPVCACGADNITSCPPTVNVRSGPGGSDRCAVIATTCN